MACAAPLDRHREPPAIVSVAPDLEGSPVARNARFRITFDAPLSPRGSRGETFRIESGDARFGVRVIHDPVSRAVEVVPTVTLDPELGHRLVIEGLVGLNGETAPLEVFPFRTSRSTGDTGPDDPRWEDVEPLFAHCARCHAGAEAPLGLDLSSPAAIRATAIGVPALEVRSVDPVSPVQPGLVGLVRLDPGSPELSFLVWKLTGEAEVPGDPMPADEPLPPGGPELLSRWVAAGAPMP